MDLAVPALRGVSGTTVWIPGRVPVYAAVEP